MNSQLNEKMEGMLAYLKEMRQFFSRGDVPKTQLIKLLGRQNHGGGFKGIRVVPHDKRFKGIMVWVNPGDVRKIVSIAFHFPDYPIRMKEVVDLFGKFKIQYNERRDYSLFLCEEWPEENPIQDFSFRLDKVKVEEEEDGSWMGGPSKGTHRELVTPEMLWFDNFIFYFKDREPPYDKDDPDGTRAGGFMGM